MKALRPRPLWSVLAPICVIVFCEFLAMGLPLSVLPGHVHAGLGFGSFVVGLVIGSQSLITLVTRPSAGTRADARGPRSTTLLGLAISVLAGIACALSTVVASPAASLAVLLAGRALLGLGESLVITAALAWGIALAGRERTGVVMAWVGIAMYGALAVGAPVGSALAARDGFVATALAAAAVPLFGLGAALLVQPVPPTNGTRLPFRRLAALIWLPGAGLALGAIGFGAIAAFSTALFVGRGWSHPELAVSAFGVAYVVARLAFARLPDRFGGARVAIGSASIALVGQIALVLAPSSAVAVIAASLTGFGFSLAFPAFGVEAMKRVPPQNRGAALGAYTACFDATLAFGIPVLGAAVGTFGAAAAFVIAAGGALASLLVALRLVVSPRG